MTNGLIKSSTDPESLNAKKHARNEKTARSIMKSAIFVSGKGGRKAAVSAAKDVARSKIQRTIAQNKAKKNKAKK